MNKRNYLVYMKNILLPCLLFCMITGVFTGALVFGFKWLASLVMTYAHHLYEFISVHPLYILVGVVALALLSLLSFGIARICPNTKGGGIPTAIAILRGVITFRWVRNLLGTFTASLITFFVGVPLGNEGPCVLLGTGVGKGAVSVMGKKSKAWERYIMTGGASAGFAVATGAPISGIFFALEEAHQRFSPMIVMAACSSVMFGVGTEAWLVSVTGKSFTLFDVSVSPLAMRDAWIALLVGVCVGLFAVLFSHVQRWIFGIFKTKLKQINSIVKIFTIYLLVFLVGVFTSFTYIGTGHELLLAILENRMVWYVLLLLLLLRMCLSLVANAANITGGLFIPMIALAGIVSSLLANGFIQLGLMDASLYVSVVVLGISACLASMVKVPITAIVFTFEVLTGTTNMLHTLVAVTFAYLVTEMFRVPSMNEMVIEARVDEINEGKEIVVVDTFVEVKPGSFVIGKQVRDIFWPHNLFVLSVKHSESRAMQDSEGGKSIQEGDTLHLRFQTCDFESTKAELLALVGEQDILEERAGMV